MIVLTDVTDSVRELASSTRAKVIERNGLTPADDESLSKELTNGVGFDDIVILNTGRCTFSGHANDLRTNEELIAQNLGVFHAH